MFRLSMCKKEAAAMADCETEALTTYLADHRNGGLGEEGLYTEITSIVTEKIKLPGGNILVTVSVIHRKPWECETYMFSLQIAGRKIIRRERKG